jgi:hypothetical protein
VCFGVSVMVHLDLVRLAIGLLAGAIEEEPNQLLLVSMDRPSNMLISDDRVLL